MDLSGFLASAASTSELQTLILSKIGSVGVPSTTFHAPVTSVQLENGHGMLLASAAIGIQFGTIV